jgi:hypothetical protein
LLDSLQKRVRLWPEVAARASGAAAIGERRAGL